MEEAHRAECIHGNVLQWPPQLNFSPWVNLTDQALSWSVYKYIIYMEKISWSLAGGEDARFGDLKVPFFNLSPSERLHHTHFECVRRSAKHMDISMGVEFSLNELLSYSKQSL